MQKNKIMLKKIRNVILLGMIMIIMLGAYNNIKNSKAEDIIEIAAGAIDDYGYLEYEEFKLEAKEIKNDLYEIELPESINTKKVNKILEVTLENTGTEEFLGEENTGTEEPLADESTLTTNTMKTLTSVGNEKIEDTENENVTEKDNAVEIVENKIYLTPDQLENKEINLKVEYDVAILEKNEEGQYNKILLTEKSEEERKELNITEETEFLYGKILEHEDENKGKVLEVKGYLPKEAKLQVTEVSKENLAQISEDRQIEGVYDINIIVEIEKEVLVDETNPEAGTTKTIEIREINPEEFGEVCEILVKNTEKSSDLQVNILKDDNTYGEVQVKEKTEESISFETQKLEIYVVSSNNDFAEIKNNNETSSVGAQDTFEVRRCYNCKFNRTYKSL